MSSAPVRNPSLLLNGYNLSRKKRERSERSTRRTRDGLVEPFGATYSSRRRAREAGAIDPPFEGKGKEKRIACYVFSSSPFSEGIVDGDIHPGSRHTHLYIYIFVCVYI